MTRQYITLIFLACLQIFSIKNVWADNLDEGVKAMAINDYARAFELWLPMARNGEKKAQHNLGLMYNNGWGVMQNFAQAMKWYRLAAEQNYMESQNNIGVLYEQGLGVNTDYAEALKWYQLAATQGSI